MRAVAKRVGAPVMTLYTHFDNKEELLDLMYAEVARRLYADNQSPSWQAEILAACRQYRRTLVEHPKWAPLLSRTAKPVVVPFRDRVIAQMQEDGIPADKALAGLSGAMLLTFGLTLVELTLGALEGEPKVPFGETSFETIPGNTEPPPPLRSMLRIDQAKNLEFVVGTYVRGLEAGARQAG